MKLEGLIKSISVNNFPPSLLQSALGCGFGVYATECDASLLNTYNLQTGLKQNKEDCKRIVSAPLAGGLLTSSFNFKEDMRQLRLSEKQVFSACCSFPGVSIEEKWRSYRTVIDTLANISFKHNVSIESVALRWLLQLNPNNIISVGTKLGMDLAEEKGGLPFRRQSDLRQVFAFSLEDEDVDRLNTVAGLSTDPCSTSSLEANLDRNFIDFNDKSLWL